MEGKEFKQEDNIGADIIVLESLCDDIEKPYLRAYWEYKVNRIAAIKKYPQWIERFATDYGGEVL
jgi:hypothetical protein